MNEIYERRSIREYTDDNISDDLLEKILKAGMNAPSARNMKPYEFIIVKDTSSLEKLSLVKKNAYMVKESKVTIVIVGKEENEFWQLDLGATIQNMLLEAAHYNIGSCWIGINKEQEDYIKQNFDIPDDMRVTSIISFGYPKEEKGNNNNYYIDKIHYEKY